MTNPSTPDSLHRESLKWIPSKNVGNLVVLLAWTSYICPVQSACLFDTPHASVATGSDAAYDAIVLSPSGDQVLTSSVVESTSSYVLNNFATGSSPGVLELVDANRSQVVSNQNPIDGSIYAAPLCTSRDGKHVYVAYPTSNEIEAYDLEAQNWTTKSSIDRFPRTVTTDVLYMGTSSNDSTLVVVTGEGIERYHRDSSTGGLVQLDETANSANPYAGITAATTDSSGDWLVAVIISSVVVIGVADTSGPVSLEQNISTSGITNVDNAVYAVMAVDDSTLYVAIGDVNKIVWFPCGIVNEVLTLTDAPDKRSANSVSYLAIDPNGNYLYDVSTKRGKLRSKFRNTTDGALTVDCVQAFAVSALSSMAVSRNGRYVYASFVDSGNGTILSFEVPQDPTPAPTPSPTRPATPLPTQAPSLQSSMTPSLGLSSAPTQLPHTVVPTTSPSSGPIVNPDPPGLASARLLDTDLALGLVFDSTCYCGKTVPSVACGERSTGCDVASLLSNETLQGMGAGASCVWADDSTEVMVNFEEGVDESWTSNVTISLPGGYIHADLVDAAEPVLYTSGTVVVVGRTPAPDLLEAQLSDEGTSITVRFSPEGSPATRLLDAGNATSGSGPGSCTSILDSASIQMLGNEPSCQWAGNRELGITLGYGATAIPDKTSTVACENTSSIALRDGGVRTEAFAVMSSSGCTAILGPENPTPAFAVLVAPQTIGLCGEVVFDGRSSSGGASRAFATVWGVSSEDGTSSAAVESLRDALASFNGSLLVTLNVTKMEVDINFVVSLTVENFLGMADEATVPVVRIGEDIPIVTAAGSSAKLVTRSLSTSLMMIASPGPCGDESSLSYVWEEIGGSGYDTLGDTILEALAGSDPTRLTIPAYTLGYPGSVYLFSGVAISEGHGLSSSIPIEVSVGQGRLRAHIYGGEYRQHTAGSDIILDGSESTDEDRITDLPLRYNWTCSRNCSTITAAYVSDGGETFTIPADNLESGVVYEFSLNISKGSTGASDMYQLFRSGVATVTVEVISYEAPQVVVWAKENQDKYDPTDKLVLYGGVVDASSTYDLLWTQVESGDLLTETKSWSTFFSSSQTGPSLVVRPHRLTGGSTYTFRLSATDSTSQARGYAQASVLINSAPYGGRIDASPRTGIAALDAFLLESLEWTDDADDLPLFYSFSYMYGHGTTAPLYSLSMYSTEYPQWEGILPIGRSEDNFTLSIAAHVSDSFGATTTAYEDSRGEAVAIRVAGWNDSLTDTDLINTMLDTFMGESGYANDRPGQVTMAVRAYASVMLEHLNSTNTSSTDLGSYQSLSAVMIQAVVADYESMDFELETTAATMDVLVLISSDAQALGIESQDALLSSSSAILLNAIDYGYWDSTISSPTLKLLDQVLGAVDGGVDNLGDNAGNDVQTIVQSFMTLVEIGLEDGEEAATFQSTYMDVSCVVTSETNGMNLVVGTSAVSFPQDVGEYSTAWRRLVAAPRTPPPQLMGKDFSRRRHFTSHQTSLLETSDTLAVAVASLAFSVNGKPSDSVTGGVTSVRVTSAVEGSEVPLVAPVTIEMKASMSMTSDIPWCSYYNNKTSEWEADGLVIASVTTQAAESEEVDSLDVVLSCTAYHLSEFAVSTTASESVFVPVELTAGFEVLSSIREISVMGIVLTFGVVLLFLGGFTAAKLVGKRRRAEGIVEDKVLARYIETGEAKRQLTLGGVMKTLPRRLGRRSARKHRAAPARHRAIRMLIETYLVWYSRARELFLQVVQNHPWAGIVAPSMSNLPLTPAQLLLLLCAQVMVQMMVEAAFSSNAASVKIKTVQILVGSAATIPGSIILPYLFESAATPPRSITTASKGWRFATSAKTASVHEEDVGGFQARPRSKGSTSSIDEEAVRRGKALPALRQLLQSAALQRCGGAGVRGAWSTNSHLARGQELVFVGFGHILVDVICAALALVVYLDTVLSQALVASTFGNLIVAVVYVDAVFTARTTMFALLNVKMVFVLAFVRVFVTLMQGGFAFHDIEQRTSPTERRLDICIFVFSLVKLFMSYKAEILPSMDEINKESVAQLSFAMKYRRRSTRVSASTAATNAGKKEGDASSSTRSLDAAATQIQAFARVIRAQKRVIRKRELRMWNHPEVYQLRRKLAIRAYVWLTVYMLAVLWVNICYVHAYDMPTVWSWVTATTLTVIVDVTLRKPVSVLMKAGIHTIRDAAQAQDAPFTQKGRNNVVF